MSRNPLIINLWAAPSSGKSTLAAGLFYQLKKRHQNVELVSEYAKQLVWSKRHKDLQDQIYIFAKQSYRIENLTHECDIIITDSPVLMGLAYAQAYPPCFRETVAWAYNRYDNLNVLVNRTATYDPVGRMQTEEQASDKHREIIDLMHEFNLTYDEVTGDDEGLERLTEIVCRRLNIG